MRSLQAKITFTMYTCIKGIAVFGNVRMTACVQALPPILTGCLIPG